MSQGQSQITEDKIRGFASFFAQQLRAFSGISQRNGGRFRYMHFDCNAGSGYNEQVGVIGSPLLFRDIARHLAVNNYVMHATEIDRTAAVTLAAKVLGEPRIKVLHGDNAELVASIPYLISAHGDRPRYALGSVLFDPNNQRSSSIPWDGIRRLSSQCPRLDIAFNFPGTAMKRINRDHDDYVDLEALPGILDKAHLLIRKPLGPWQFTLVLARNHRFGDHKSIGLYDWDSPEGRMTRRRVSMTRAELANEAREPQQDLPWPDTEPTENT